MDLEAEERAWPLPAAVLRPTASGDEGEPAGSLWNTDQAALWVMGVQTVTTLPDRANPDPWLGLDGVSLQFE